MSTTTTDKATQIQALLAKAESTDSPHEAEALIAKAQELMARYSIDEAMLRSAKPGEREEAMVMDFVIHGPHAKAKASILNATAMYNGGKLVVNPKLTGGNLRCYIGGFASDVDRIKNLFTSMLIVAQHELIRERRINPMHGKSLAHGFFIGFGDRIGDRLAEAERLAKAATVDTHSMDLVLVDRKTLVNRVMAKKLGPTRTGSTRMRADAYDKGWAAGGSANLNANLGGGGRRAIG